MAKYAVTCILYVEAEDSEKAQDNAYYLNHDEILGVDIISAENMDEDEEVPT